MTEQRPVEPESLDRAPQSEIRGLSPNSISPRPVPLGFPVDAVANLRAEQRQLDPDGVEVGVSRQAVDEVLAWIDRYIPRPVATTEDAVVVDAIKVLQVDGEPFLDEVDLIRCNGRAFVPETVVEVAVVDMIVDRFRADIGEALEMSFDLDAGDSQVAAGIEDMIERANLAGLAERLVTAERVRDDCRRTSERNINRRRELAERVLDCEAMLSAAGQRFREYEKIHRDKVAAWEARIEETVPEGNGVVVIRELRNAISDTLIKAEANAEIAGRIEAVLMTLRPVT